MTDRCAGHVEVPNPARQVGSGWLQLPKGQPITFIKRWILHAHCKISVKGDSHEVEVLAGTEPCAQSGKRGWP